MRVPFQEGEFPFPVKYGYAMVGRDRGRAGGADRRKGVLPAPAPDPVRDSGRRRPNNPQRCAGRPRRAGSADGDGAQRHLGRGYKDRRPDRGGRRRRDRLPGRLSVRASAGRRGDPDRPAQPGTPSRRQPPGRRLYAPYKPPPAGCDIVFHASATAQGLNLALSLAGFEATIVELSWYGDEAGFSRSRRRLPQPEAAAGLIAGWRGIAPGAARAMGPSTAALAGVIPVRRPQAGCSGD